MVTLSTPELHFFSKFLGEREGSADLVKCEQQDSSALSGLFTLY